MTNNLRELLNKNQKQTYATDHGTRMHARLSAIYISNDGTTGDADLAASISANPKLRFLFGPTSKPEVPVAGYLDGKFISCRIDRLLIDNATKQIYILDYKTDTNPDTLRDKYTQQLRTYATLLHDIYPTYAIHKYILWLHTWELEEIA